MKHKKAMETKLIGIDRQLLYRDKVTSKFTKIVGTALAFATVIALWWFLVIGVIGTHK